MKRKKWETWMPVWQNLLFLRWKWWGRNGHWMRVSKRPRRYWHEQGVR